MKKVKESTLIIAEIMNKWAYYDIDRLPEITYSKALECDRKHDTRIFTQLLTVLTREKKEKANNYISYLSRR